MTSFWTSTFAWDLLNAMVPVILSVILFAAFRVDGYTGDGLFGVFLLLVWTALLHIFLMHLRSISNTSISFTNDAALLQHILTLMTFTAF